MHPRVFNRLLHLLNVLFATETIGARCITKDVVWRRKKAWCGGRCGLELL
jgi:hypothetical protein